MKRCKMTKKIFKVMTSIFLEYKKAAVKSGGSFFENPAINLDEPLILAFSC